MPLLALVPAHVLAAAVYVEKPIVTKEDDLPALVDMADEREVLLFTGTQRRLEDPFKYLLRVVTENYGFGELKRIRCHLAAGHDLKGWRRDPNLAGGGIITDAGYHLLDIAAWLCNSNGSLTTDWDQREPLLDSPHIHG